MKMPLGRNDGVLSNFSVCWGGGVGVERFFVSGWCSVVLEVLVSKMSLPIS